MFFRRSIHPSQADLSAYVDGELAVAVARTIALHAETCAVCRSQLAELRDTKSLLADLPRVVLPRTFTLSAAQVGEQRPMPVSKPSPLRFVPAMALSLFVALVLVDVASLPSGSNDASSGASSGGLTAKSSAESADTAVQQPQTTTAAGNVPALAPAPSAPPVGGAGGAAADAGAPPQPATAAGAPTNQAAPVEGFAPPSPAAAEQAARSALSAPTPAVAPPVPGAVPSVVVPYGEPPQDSEAHRDSSESESDSGIGLLRLLQILAASGFVVSLLVLAWPKLTRKEP